MYLSSVFLCVCVCVCVCVSLSCFHCQTDGPIRLKIGMWSPYDRECQYPPVDVVSITHVYVLLESVIGLAELDLNELANHIHSHTHGRVITHPVTWTPHVLAALDHWTNQAKIW